MADRKLDLTSSYLNTFSPNFRPMISDLILAKDAAIEAGGVILNYYKADYEIRDKGYHNPVTTADHAADACLKDILMKARPEYG